MRLFDFARLRELFPLLAAGTAPERKVKMPHRDGTAAAERPHPSRELPRGLAALLASVKRDSWHVPMLRAVMELVAAGWEDDDIHAVAQEYRFDIGEVQTRHDVDEFIRWARKKGVGQEVRGALRTDVPPAYPAEPLPPDEAKRRLRTEVEKLFERARTHNAARRELADRRSEFSLERCRGRARVELLAADVFPADGFEKAVERRARSIRAREWKRIKGDVLAKYHFESVAQGPRLAIRAAAGLGKTAEVVRYIKEHPETRDLTIVVFTPRLDLAEEVEKQFGLGQHVRVVRGREAKAPQGGPMCAKPQAAKLAARLHLNVFRTLCMNGPTRCPHFEECPWIGQWAPGPGIYIAAHEYLILPSLLPPRPDLAVIDESFFEKGVGRTEFAPDRLLEEAPWQTQEVRACLRKVYDALEGGEPLLKALGLRVVTRKVLLAAARAAEEDLETKSGVDPQTTEKDAVEHLSALEESERLKLARMCRQLAAEINIPRDLCNSVWLERERVVKVDDTRERQHRVMVACRHRLRIPKSVPVLRIDADADAEIERRFLGPDLEHVSIPVERNAEVIQCYARTFCKTSLLGYAEDQHAADAVRLLDAVKSFIADKTKGLRVLVVTNLPVRRKITGESEGKTGMYFEFSGAQISHFGRIRGIDAYKDADLIIVVGREQPPPGAVEVLARGLYFDDPEALKLTGGYSKAPRGYRLRDGRHLGVEVDVHEDSRVQRVLELKRECESAQAIDRVRLVHCAKPKRVFVLCNVPLDITVDKLVSWVELRGGKARIQRAWEWSGHVLPLVPTWLAVHFPGLFSSVEAVRYSLNTERLDVGKSQYILIGISPYLPRFRPANEHRGGIHNWSRALLPVDSEYFRSKLSKLMKSVLEWEQPPTGRIFLEGTA